MTIQYNANARANLTPELWAKFDIHGIKTGQTPGVFFYDDFKNTPKFASAASQNGYQTYQDTSATVQGVAGTERILRFSTAATDNNEAWLTTGANLSCLGKIASSGGTKCVMEARFRVGQITDQGIFIGMSEEGLAAANTLTDNDGALASKDFVGFHVDTAGPTALDAVHRKAGAAAVVVKAAAQTLVASTLYKVGWVFDPNDSDGEVLRFYVNGTEVGSVSDVSVSTFPDGEELALLAGIKTGDATDRTLDLDFWAFGQAL